MSIIRKTFYLPINAKTEALPNEKRKKKPKQTKREKRCTYAREQTHTYPFYIFSTLDLQFLYTRARILPQEVHEYYQSKTLKPLQQLSGCVWVPIYYRHGVQKKLSAALYDKEF